jgi:hypothetical protein
MGRDSCINVNKSWVNDLGFAFIGKVGLGPFWNLVQVLFYVHVLHVIVSSLVSSFRHERVATAGKIYMTDAYASMNLVNLIK